jgi:hypothetical protein
MALQFGFRLWDGSLVPADWPRDALALAIADEGVVAALLRAPRVTTLANLWAAKRLDIVNGGIFDLVEKRPKVRTRELTRNVSKARATPWGRQAGTKTRHFPAEPRNTSGGASRNRRQGFAGLNPRQTARRQNVSLQGVVDPTITASERCSTM